VLNDNKINRETFCVLPWMHQVVVPNGSYSHCCVSFPNHIMDDYVYCVENATFFDARNSDYMKNTRRQMLKGEVPVQCRRCFDEEQLGKKSHRIRSNEAWDSAAVHSLVEYSIANDFSVVEDPTYLDLRLGNRCNLKCRMCSPWNSDKVYDETIELLHDDSFKEIWTTTYGQPPQKIGPWYNSDKFWDDVKSNKNIKKIYMTGGEPTLINKNYEYMEYLIEQGLGDKVELFFNLNGTNIQGRFIELLKAFSKVSINVSADGKDDLQHYIRYPSNWDVIEKNFIALMKIKHINLGVTPVLQTYNVLGLDRLLYFLDGCENQYQRKIHIDILISYHPNYSNALVMPETIRKIGAERLNTFREQSIICQRDQLSNNSIHSATEFLLSTCEYEKYIEQFVSYTRILDRHRNMHLIDMGPELWNLLNDNNIII